MPKEGYRLQQKDGGERGKIGDGSRERQATSYFVFLDGVSSKCLPPGRQTEWKKRLVLRCSPTDANPHMPRADSRRVVPTARCHFWHRGSASSAPLDPSRIKRCAVTILRGDDHFQAAEEISDTGRARPCGLRETGIAAGTIVEWPGWGKGVTKGICGSGVVAREPNDNVRATLVSELAQEGIGIWDHSC